MKRMNKHVENTKNQIANTLQILSTCGLARMIKDVVFTSSQGIEMLTWDNHVSGRHNAGKSFTMLEQYVSIYETGAYHGILFDGSIIRVQLKFEKNILVQESLLYWPAPIIIPEDDIDELGVREAANLYFSEINVASKNFAMRSPLRYDFDSSNDNEHHPAAHVHMQHSECRLSAKRPICFNTFIKFIFTNFYPDVYPKVLDELEPLNYSGYQIRDKSIISL